DVTGNTIGGWWCGDIEEPNVVTCQGDPDLFFKLTSGGNTTTSSTVSNSMSATWNNLSIPLESPAFSINFWDEDGRCPVFCSPDDDGGTAIITINQNNGNNGAGNYTFATSAPSGGGVTGSLTIGLRVRTSDSCTDTFQVLQSPSIPLISNVSSHSNTVCFGDSVILVSSPADEYRWYRDTVALG